MLTWEFNVQCAEDAHAPDVCACVADNNDETFAGLSRDNEQCFEASAANATVLHRAGANQTTAALGGGGPRERHAIEHDDAAPASDAAAEMAPQMAVLPPSRGTRHAPHRAAIPGSACATRVATRRAATRSATGRLTPSRARR